ncbi:hypothetical protein F5X68DRAFT_178007 [Plectosphaerella plurivora]|uniref:Uncharacterized protein n=1 Tax=Plectosphaerella plurivora TaxID=936078 RepID=A0A9P9A6H5_9PEZI|nr:hypothetical protein F5X68DRAFT_178007 [Plectosphaerella plurivora]
MSNIARSLLPTLLASSLLPPTLAQQSNRSSTDNCPRALRDIVDDRTAFNSTGSASFRLGQNEDWFLSYSLTDRRHEFFNSGQFVTVQSLEVYLSVPELFIGTEQGNNTRFCMYMMPGRNETSDDEAGNDVGSCSGILSDECIQAMRDVPPPEDGNCPQADIREQCGFGTLVGRGAPSNFSDPTCTVNGVPSVDLPEDYRTYGGFTGTHLMPPDPDKATFEVYDLRVRQPVPMLITSRRGGSGESDSAVVCLAPSNVTEGSREPEGDFPPSAASSLNLKGSVVWGLALVGLTGYILL